ncbi:MAG TPA: aldo/keto reductase [Tepidisphaeraceae bacterium]|nr:aldo/keto reductase [Tepidisphaeraceae bacterium]
MKQTTLGKTGLSVTPLGFGSAPVGYVGAGDDSDARLLNAVLDSGINLIDTAASYKGAEKLIGSAIGHRRGEYVLVSKCGQKIPEAGDAKEWSAAVITATVDRALKRLQTDSLDVMLLHSCDLETLQKGEALGALVKAREAGKIKFAGYSGDNEAAAYAAGLPDVAVIETSINMADQVNIHKVLPLARQNNVGILAKRPIANAAWRQPTEQKGFYGDYAQVYHDRLKQMKLKPEELGFPADGWSELALRFTLSQPGTHVAIIGTTNPNNLQSNVAAVTKGPLPAETIEKIRAAFVAANPDGSWTGQT